MQYHLDTIPVWNAMEEHAECPICALSQKTEQLEIERSLGGSVMEPSVRIRVNEVGFCAKHHQMLFAENNRLGHALMVDSHTKELLKKVERLSRQVQGKEGGVKALFSKPADTSLDELISGLEKLSSTCAVCESLEANMKRYLHTFVHLWKQESKFRAAIAASHGVCVPHSALLLRQAKKDLPPAQQKEFAAMLTGLLCKNLEENEKDLAWFNQKHDYRNQDKPWGNSKNALERTVNRLRGKCVGNEGKK